MCMKASDYRKDMFVRAKLQFESFDYATQPQKPHWESVRPVFALLYEQGVHLIHYFQVQRYRHCLPLKVNLTHILLSYPFCSLGMDERDLFFRLLTSLQLKPPAFTMRMLK